MSTNAMLAIDLGAESGRAILGELDEDDQLQLIELNRFRNEPERRGNGLYWSNDDLLCNILETLKDLRSMLAHSDTRLRSVGVDTWGVDYALFRSDGIPLETPHCYRDERNQPAFEKTLAALGEKWLYDRTGIQFMPLNTLFQLVAERDADPDVLQRADKMLFMPDLFHCALSENVMHAELTIASTSGMLDPRTNQWSIEVIEAAGLPTHLLPEIVEPGTDYGPINEMCAAGLGLDPSIRIIAPASHDTASAVAAAPVDPHADGEWCFLSSGTWSLLGAELPAPFISDEARLAPFTNEKGVGGTTRFLKNIAGLWLVQQCRRDFKKKKMNFDYATLAAMAENAEPFRTLIDPAHAPFAEPGKMLKKIDAFAQQTGQPTPNSPGEYARTCYESLALSYRDTLMKLEGILDRRFSTIHILGGGGRNKLLNRMTADATGRRVIVGPHEATSIGNILVQAMGLGLVRDVAHLRSIVRNSFSPTVIDPRDTSPWDRAYDRFRAICQA